MEDGVGKQKEKESTMEEDWYAGDEEDMLDDETVEEEVKSTAGHEIGKKVEEG